LTGEVGPDMITWHHVTEENSVHIFWLLPQYLVLTVGEILFSITSMEFAYSQAPATMKSVLQVGAPACTQPTWHMAAWQAMYLMTTAVGNLITMIIVEIFSAIGWEQVGDGSCNVGVTF
jgi:solute carrier family 15 oligopeptide transporter 1